MYISMIELMKKAREGHYCVPAIAVENEHSVRAAIQAAEEKKSPLIMIALYKVNPDIHYFGRIVEDLAIRAKVPVAMCQDHGGTYAEAMWAIRAGFTDVMVDRSTLPFEENIAQVSEIVKVAHAVGVGVEAELGHVGMANQYETDGTGGFTVPEEAIEFVERTGVDALAVAIGTAHGVYSGVPKLQFDLLAELREKVPVPLVLHGGSGTGDENLKKACQMGICKLNISNDLKRGAIANLNEKCKDGMGAYAMYPLLYEGYKNVAAHYMTLCGSEGKA
ncbi:class II fructose-bisphosphate aldolase [Laedolimicola intestinihominis]|uniref:Class II fructose-bisphosphate aldolase n=1 Tax=Laedolimicola intestinihominis TaxID=3133166 RepID=A0ABV1FLP9_9FIRM|nr:class II fructose-bisphosphate aldolase [Lachnospiraceae bacterium]MBD9158200.1 class II fructose-bisphosphate aldolase [Lachnospiraceae bacterium]